MGLARVSYDIEITRDETVMKFPLVRIMGITKNYSMSFLVPTAFRKKLESETQSTWKEFHANLPLHICIFSSGFIIILFCSREIFYKASFGIAA